MISGFISERVNTVQSAMGRINFGARRTDSVPEMILDDEYQNLGVLSILAPKQILLIWLTWAKKKENIFMMITSLLMRSAYLKNIQ